MRKASVVVKDIAIGTGGLGFDFLDCQIVRSVASRQRHRCDVSSELCCLRPKPQRWARQPLHSSA